MRLKALPVVGIVLATVLVVIGAYLADWRQVALAFGGVDKQLVLVSLVLLIGTFIVFAARWGRLIAIEPSPSTARLFRFMMIGYFANAILPARPGDVIRAVLLRQSYRVGMSSAVASLVLERLIDLSAVCTLGIVMSFLMPLPTMLLSAIYAVSAGVFGFLLALLFVNWRRESLHRFVERHSRLFGGRVMRPIIASLRRFVAGINLLKSVRRLTASIALTAAGWLLLTAFTMCMIAAFALPVPLSAALLVLVGTNLGALMPLSPGAIGVWHFMAVLALTLWGIDNSTAIAFAIGTHAVAIGLHIALGLGCAWYEGIRPAFLKMVQER